MPNGLSTSSMNKAKVTVTDKAMGTTKKSSSLPWCYGIAFAVATYCISRSTSMDLSITMKESNKFESTNYGTIEVSMKKGLLGSGPVVAELSRPSFSPPADSLWTPKYNVSSYDPTHPLLLSVPFYVYEELLWDTNTSTLGGKSLQERADRGFGGRIGKHSNDYWFVQSALHHPLRTLDPNQAKIFVIPTLCNIGQNREIRKGERLCIEYLHSRERRCNKDIFSHDAEILFNSTFFQRHQGRDHIMTASPFTNGHPSRMPTGFASLIMNNTNLLVFEDNFGSNKADRISYSSYYVGNPCPSAKDISKTTDIAMIASIKKTVDFPDFIDRANICEWLEAGNKNESVHMSVCGKGTQCPALSHAKYGFHVRGDTWGANRLMDTVLSNTIPVFTSPNQYKIEPPWINWPQLSEIVNVSTKETLLQDLDRILKDTDLYKQKQLAVQRHRHLFDWMTLYPFDTYMYMLQGYLYPSTKIPQSKNPYTALILP